MAEPESPRTACLAQYLPEGFECTVAVLHRVLRLSAAADHKGKPFLLTIEAKLIDTVRYTRPKSDQAEFVARLQLLFKDPSLPPITLRIVGELKPSNPPKSVEKVLLRLVEAIHQAKDVAKADQALPSPDKPQDWNVMKVSQQQMVQASAILPREPSQPAEPAVHPAHYDEGLLIECHVLSFYDQGTHVTFKIETRTNIPAYIAALAKAGEENKSTTRVEVEHRYSDFERLAANLKTNHPNASVPALPLKNAFFSQKDAQFLQDRQKGLDSFLRAAVANPFLRESSVLIEFLTLKGNVSSQPSKAALLYQYARPLVDHVPVATAERYIANLVTSPAGKPKPTFNTAIEEDFWAVRSLMGKYKLTPKKLPFDKFVTLVLGTTSSGKSAFANHFFGVPIKKSADNQQDTGFTIIEVVDSQTFEDYSNRPISSAEEERIGRVLHTPLKDVDSDIRNGTVFVYLNQVQTIARYDQLGQYQEGLFQAVLINRRFLNKKHPNYALASKCIVIDSPGFDSVQVMDIADKFTGNLKLLQYLYNMSDMLLYFIPSGQVTQVSSQIPLLELSVVYALRGEEDMDSMLKEMTSKGRRDDKAKSFFGGMVYDLCDAIINFRKKPSGGVQELTYQGTSCWHKTYFVLTKIDQVYRSAINGAKGDNQRTEAMLRAVNGQYFELGVLLGSSLKRLPPPVFDYSLAIGLPEAQPAENRFTADLELLLAKIAMRESQAPYLQRVESSIQQMCRELEAYMQGAWGASYLQYIPGGSDLPTIRELLERSLRRVKGSATDRRGSHPN